MFFSISEAMAVAITWIGDGGASHDVEVDVEDVEPRPGPPNSSAMTQLRSCWDYVGIMG